MNWVMFNGSFNCAMTYELLYFINGLKNEAYNVKIYFSDNLYCLLKQQGYFVITKKASI